MNAHQALIVANLLNGASVQDVAVAFHESPEEVLAMFEATMRKVAEYALVHCLPQFECRNLDAARLNRRRVMDALSAIQVWDGVERDTVLALFRGENVLEKFGLPRAEAEKLLKRTLDAVPHYLTVEQVASYTRDRQGFIRSNKSRVIEAIEGFVSFRNPIVYKHIEHQVIRAEA